MTDQGSIPPDLFASLQRMWRQDIAAAQRSASIRNSSISSGGSFEITGGAFVMKQADGRNIFYIGPVQPPRFDGSDQPGWQVIRADGTTVLAMFDASPTTSGATLRQALNWYDRRGNPVIADDTNGGEGIASPWIPMPTLRSTDTTTWDKTTATTWTEIARSAVFQQHPKLYWQASGSCGGTGQVQLQVQDFSSNVIVSSAVHTVTGGVSWNETITIPSGFWHQNNVLSLQAQVTAGTGSINVQTFGLYGRQT